MASIATLFAADSFSTLGHGWTGRVGNTTRTDLRRTPSKRSWKVRWQTNRSQGNGQVLDVSPHGAFLQENDRTRQTLTVGDRIRLLFAGPDPKARLSVIGTVIARKKSSTHRCLGFQIRFEKQNTAVFSAVWGMSTDATGQPAQI